MKRRFTLTKLETYEFQAVEQHCDHSICLRLVAAAEQVEVVENVREWLRMLEVVERFGRRESCDRSFILPDRSPRDRLVDITSTGILLSRNRLSQSFLEIRANCILESIDRHLLPPRQNSLKLSFQQLERFNLVIDFI